MTPSGAGHLIGEMKVSNEKANQSGQAGPDEGKFERWTAQRKAAIILDVLKGQISVPEAARKHGFTQAEFREWTEEYHRAGPMHSRSTRKALKRSIAPR